MALARAALIAFWRRIPVWLRWVGAGVLAIPILYWVLAGWVAGQRADLAAAKAALVDAEAARDRVAGERDRIAREAEGIQAAYRNQARRLAEAESKASLVKCTAGWYILRSPDGSTVEGCEGSSEAGLTWSRTALTDDRPVFAPPILPIGPPPSVAAAAGWYVQALLGAGWAVPVAAGPSGPAMLGGWQIPVGALVRRARFGVGPVFILGQHQNAIQAVLSWDLRKKTTGG